MYQRTFKTFYFKSSFSEVIIKKSSSNNFEELFLFEENLIIKPLFFLFFTL
ncbi:hypothetical protein GIHI108528_06265 [Gillisia hiemivivida]